MTLSERLLRACEYPNSKYQDYNDSFICGAADENKRLQPLIKAMIECVENADRILRDPKYTSQIALCSHEHSLANLERVLKEMEGG